jgi:Tol biopolymer transport system component
MARLVYRLILSGAVALGLALGVGVVAPGAVAAGPSSPGRLAFVKDGDIWVEDLPAGAAQRLTHDGQNDTPLWSPSGQWLAFRRAERQLWVVRSSGADAHEVDSNATGPFAWSPVADRLAYLAGGGLVTVGADGLNRRALVAPGGPPGAGVLSFAWSPDGGEIAYAQTQVLAEAKAGQPPVRFARLAHIRSDGSAAAEILNAGKPSTYGLIVAGWSPDGADVLYWIDPVFSASLLADGTSLLAVPASGGTPTRVVRWMLAHRDVLSWSPDGARLAVAEGAGRIAWRDKTIAVATLNGSVQTISPSNRADLFPSWSPDGRWIAFAGAPSSSANVVGGQPALTAMAGRRIWVARPDGTDRRQLTNDTAYRDERPEWSADGDWILFPRLRGEQAQLWLMRSDGSDARRVVDELGPGPDLFGYYGYLDWARLYDWSGRSRLATNKLPTTGGPPITMLLMAGALGVALIVGGIVARPRSQE